MTNDGERMLMVLGPRVRVGNQGSTIGIEGEGVYRSAAARKVASEASDIRWTNRGFYVHPYDLPIMANTPVVLRPPIEVCSTWRWVEG